MGEGEGLCPRCGEAKETLFHRYWACRCNDDIDEEVIRNTDRYKEAAAEGPACFWLRGLVPVAHTFGLLPEPEEKVWSTERFQEARAALQAQGLTEPEHVCLFGRAELV